jgi:transformation/transcription domain-associated protein
LHKNYRSVNCVGPCGGAAKADAVVKRTGHCSLCWSCAKARLAAEGSGDQFDRGADAGSEMDGMVQICLRDSVQPFLDTVQALYRRLPQSVAAHFPTAAAASAWASGESAAAAAGAAVLAAAAATSESALSGPLICGVDSFKVLTECPLIVMLLFQLYPEFISSVPARAASSGEASGNIPQLIPLMMQALQPPPPPPLAAAATSAHAAASLASPPPPQKGYKELVGCQVKTLSFLTYLLRGFAELMRPFEDAIAAAVVGLLRACPGDAVAVRKELLVATRHILATDFRRGFFKHVDAFLDEALLVGATASASSASSSSSPHGPSIHSAAHDALRPLAYSTLADLVHHVRASLNLQQLAKVVHMYSKNIHSDTLPVTIQTTSVRHEKR